MRNSATATKAVRENSPSHDYRQEAMQSNIGSQHQAKLSPSSSLIGIDADIIALNDQLDEAIHRVTGLADRLLGDEPTNVSTAAQNMMQDITSNGFIGMMQNRVMRSLGAISSLHSQLTRLEGMV